MPGAATFAGAVRRPPSGWFSITWGGMSELSGAIPKYRWLDHFSRNSGFTGRSQSCGALAGHLEGIREPTGRACDPKIARLRS